MSTSELQMKLDLINRISILDDARIIKEIKKLLDFELDEKVYELNQLIFYEFNEKEIIIQSVWDGRRNTK